MGWFAQIESTWVLKFTTTASTFGRVIWSYSDYHCYLGVHVNTFLVCVCTKGAPKATIFIHRFWHSWSLENTHCLIQTCQPLFVSTSFPVKQYSPSNIIQPPGTTFTWLCARKQSWKVLKDFSRGSDLYSLTSNIQHIWMLVSNIFRFHPYLGKIPNLTNIFQRGWNHQLDILNVSTKGFLRQPVWSM